MPGGPRTNFWIRLSSKRQRINDNNYSFSPVIPFWTSLLMRDSLVNPSRWIVSRKTAAPPPNIARPERGFSGQYYIAPTPGRTGQSVQKIAMILATDPWSKRELVYASTCTSCLFLEDSKHDSIFNTRLAGIRAFGAMTGASYVAHTQRGAMNAGGAIVEQNATRRPEGC